LTYKRHDASNFKYQQKLANCKNKRYQASYLLIYPKHKTFPKKKKKKKRFTGKNLENRCHQNCIDQTKIEFSPHPESCLQIPAEQNLPIPKELKTLAYLIVV
jgi:5-methylcytosine-specific restriction endonuclease McrBC regulatory subunit McrC